MTHLWKGLSWHVPIAWIWSTNHHCTINTYNPYTIQLVHIIHTQYNYITIHNNGVFAYTDTPGLLLSFLLLCIVFFFFGEILICIVYVVSVSLHMKQKKQKEKQKWRRERKKCCFTRKKMWMLVSQSHMPAGCRREVPRSPALLHVTHHLTFPIIYSLVQYRFPPHFSFLQLIILMHKYLKKKLLLLVTHK